MKFAVFQLSRQGGRAQNEDRMGYCYTREAGLFLLADGMGGHAEGEVAAQIALQTIAAQFQREATPLLDDVTGFLTSALLQAHRQILRYAQSKHMADTPRTTLVAAVVQQGEATWVHCGDSRLYWVRDGQELARTRDHSFAELARSGTPLKGVASHHNRNVLYTCLGAPQRPVFDVAGPHPLEVGDRLLLCSDGLWDALPPHALLQGLSAGGLDVAVPALVDGALEAAGSHSDNVTALAVEWQQHVPDPGGALGAPRGAGALGLEGEDSQFLTTIQPAATGAEAADSIDPLDDAAIERSIAEINAAIQRSTQRRP